MVVKVIIIAITATIITTVAVAVGVIQRR